MFHVRYMNISITHMAKVVYFVQCVFAHNKWMILYIEIHSIFVFDVEF